MIQTTALQKTQMETIKWDRFSYRIDGRRQFLISGEFHYFRVPKTDWKRRLELFKEAGGNCCATYIPWILHEPEEGTVLVGDAPERDLESFLQLCHELELLVICRPGPYQYSEMKYDGLPGWLCENYPEIHAANVHGQAFRKASVSYLHPVFLDKVERWYAAICPVIARYTLSNGGPVAFLQVDNEMMGVHQWFGGGWDYNAVAMGIGRQGGRYPLYLQEKYAEIEALNRAYGTAFSGFSDVRPFDGGAPRNDEERRRVKDYQDFYFGTVAEYAKILTAWARQAGIDCPIVHNSPNPASNPQFLEVARAMGKEFLLGSDHYYTLGPDWEQNNPTPQYAGKVLLSNDMLQQMGYPATVFELPGGSASDWPPVTPEDFRACYLTNLAFGMKGLNYYIFTGGLNPSGIGAFSEIYDYGAAISYDGVIRPIYDVVMEFGKFLKEKEWLAGASRVTDFRIGYCWEYGRSYSYFSSDGDHLYSSARAWDFMRTGIATGALCSSYAPGYAALDTADIRDCLDQPLFVPASSVMPEPVQRKLVKFLENGGRLFIGPVLPEMDENFRTCTVLRDFLGGPVIERCDQSFPVVTVGDIRQILMNGGLFRSVRKPDNAHVIAVEERSGSEIGWKMTCKGGGTALWLGFWWKYSMFEHGRMVRCLLQELGCSSPVVSCDNSNLWTALHTDGNRLMLFVMNLYSAAMEADIKVRTPKGSVLDSGRLRLEPMQVRTFELEIR